MRIGGFQAVPEIQVWHADTGRVEYGRPVGPRGKGNNPLQVPKRPQDCKPDWYTWRGNAANRSSGEMELALPSGFEPYLAVFSDTFWLSSQKITPGGTQDLIYNIKIKPI